MSPRRPTPTILLTAIAATVVMVPWAVGGLPGDDEQHALADDTVLAQQPLAGVGGGETVREISQETPFSMVALTGSDLTGTTARLRAKRADGSWGPWYNAERFELGSEDVEGNGTQGTDPVYVGDTTTVQIAVTRPADAPVTIEPAQSGLDAGRELGYIPANAQEPLSQTMSAVLISPPQAPVDTQWTPPTAALGP